MDTSITTTATMMHHQPQQQQQQQQYVHLEGEKAFSTTPVLSLELENISKMSKGGREGLSYMWTVFSRCKESIQDGRRLENLSWRLWYEDLKLAGCISGVSNLPVTCSSSSLSDPEASDSDSDSSFSSSEFSEDIDKSPTGQGNTTVDRNSNDKIGEVVQELRVSSVNEKRTPVGESAETIRAEQTGVEFGTQPNNTTQQTATALRTTTGPDTCPTTLQGCEPAQDQGPDPTTATAEVHSHHGKDGQDAGQSSSILPVSSSSGSNHTPTIRREDDDSIVVMPTRLADELEHSHGQITARPQAFNSASTAASSSTTDSGAASIPAVASVAAGPSKINPTTVASISPSTSNLSTTSRSPLQHHIRRSSCPPSRDREMLRVSHIAEPSSGASNHHHHHHHHSHHHSSNTTNSINKKDKRASSFATAHCHKERQKFGQGLLAKNAAGERSLTPGAIQDIIGTVLPMNFKNQLYSTSRQNVSSNEQSVTTTPATVAQDIAMPVEPVVVEQQVKTPSPPSFPAPVIVAPTPASSVVVPTLSSAVDSIKRTSPTPQQPSHGILKRGSSPLRQSQSQHAREPSVKSERSYFTSTTATSVSTSDIKFSPNLVASDVDKASRSESGVMVPTTSAPPANLGTLSTFNISAPSPRLTQSEDTPTVPSPDEPLSPDSETPSSSSMGMTRSSSHHKVSARPALISARHNKHHSASGVKLNRSAIQRTQSAKSVRIIESPTEADGAAVSSGASQEAMHAVTAATSIAHPNHAQHKHTQPHSKPAFNASKRSSSSSKLKNTHGHVRNGSSISLTRQRSQSPPAIMKMTATTTPAEQGSLAPAAQLEAVHMPMQAAPHVTKAINIRRNNSSLANIIQTQPKSVSKGFHVTDGSADNTSSAIMSTSSSAQDGRNSTPVLHPPPPSPASPAVLVPSSVILPPQPRPSPADPRFRVHSSIRRPASPPVGSSESPEEEFAIVQQQQGTSQARLLHDSQQQVQDIVEYKGKQSRPAKRSETVNAGPAASTAPRDMKPEPQPLTNAKKKQMFFLSSPTTDSDDEGPCSLTRQALNSKNDAPLAQKQHQQQRNNVKATEAQEANPLIKVDKVVANAEAKSKSGESKTNGHHSDDDDEDYEDEDDSDWSNESSESEDEHQAAIRAEEERQRAMFAKRTPSMVASQGGLLSKLLRPEEYGRGHANMPSHLRDNKSVMHLNHLPNVSRMPGLERAQTSTNPHLTVTGMNASKSAAALPDLLAVQTSRLVPSRSGNHLTRLGGAPSGVELESDDDDDDDAEHAQEISPTQQMKLAALMQRTTSSRGGKRSPSPVRAQVTRTLSAAQITPVQPAPVISPHASETVVFTPRTTRRTMLSTELTESLRASLLNERRSRSGLVAGLVNGIGNRFVGRTSQPAGIAANTTEANQLPPPPPQIQRGSTDFTPAVQDRKPGQVRPGLTTNKSSSSRVHTLRPTSDPHATAEYYSPGFHHTGW